MVALAVVQGDSALLIQVKAQVQPRILPLKGGLHQLVAQRIRQLLTDALRLRLLIVGFLCHNRSNPPE